MYTHTKWTNSDQHTSPHAVTQSWTNTGDEKKETELEKKTNNRPGYMHTDGQTNICSLSFSNTKKKAQTRIQSAWQLKRLSPQFPLRVRQNLTNSTDAKTKELMEEIVHQHHLLRLYLRLPAFLPSHLCCFLGWLADWLPTVRILNERPFLPSQSASQSVT